MSGREKLRVRKGVMRTVQVVSDLDLYRLYLPLEIRWLQLPSTDEICKEVDSPNTKLYGPYTSPCRNIENIMHTSR